MKLKNVKVKGFRLLHDISIFFSDNTTSIVGKNNSGKTSFTAIFDHFLKKKKFTFADFSIKSHQDFINVYKKYIVEKTMDITAAQKLIPKIQLVLDIEYSKDDNWSTLRPFITSLEKSNRIHILCEYAPESTQNFLDALSETLEKNASNEEILNQISSLLVSFYDSKYGPVNSEDNSIVFSLGDINTLLGVKFIKAQRVLDDSSEDSKSKLSGTFQSFFNTQNAENAKVSEDLHNSIQKAGESIDTELANFFAPFIDSFNIFGFPGMGDEKVELKSKLEPNVLFKNNIKLFYNQNGTNLPEKYNGLGYSNLIYIISQIIGFYNDHKTSPHDLNLIFIEEPEAHMHPQMQSVFIKNINTFLEKFGMQAQVIVTTHSSHILSNSSFDNIRYFLRTDSDKISSLVKDLSDFKINNSEGDKREAIEFLEQYLTLGKCDLFFADKAIFVEGTVERILLPVFIKKSNCGLQNEYVTSIEVGGTYIYLFKDLLEFLELKTLIVTDIDSIDAKHKNKCELALKTNQLTSNETLKKWLPRKSSINELLKDDIIKVSADKKCRVAYQTVKKIDKNLIKCGRTFEEAFIIENAKYILDNKTNLKSISNSKLKGCESVKDVLANSYQIQEFIDGNRRKTDLTFELLTQNQDDWEVPEYINEGLLWLAK